MTAHELQRLRSGEADCPSDLALDQLHAGELEGPRAEALRAHTGGCAACSARLAERAAGFGAFPALAPDRHLDAILRRGGPQAAAPARPNPSQKGRWLRRVTLYAAPLAAAAALLVFINHAPQQDPAAPETRAKGGLALHVFRQAASGDGRGVRALSGDRFKPGDRLRFVVDLPSDGGVRVIGVESGGDLYVAWPAEKDAPAALPAGDGQELPGAVALDQRPGKESLYLVHCPADAAPPRCTSTGAATRPRCPAGCQLAPFLIDKGP